MVGWLVLAFIVVGCVFIMAWCIVETDTGTSFCESLAPRVELRENPESYDKIKIKCVGNRLDIEYKGGN